MKENFSSQKNQLTQENSQPLSVKNDVYFGKDDKTEAIWKKKLDDTKNRVLNRRTYLIDLQDKLEEYSKTNTLIVDEEASNKRIKILENKVDNLMIKFNEAMNIKRMYEGLITNLKQQKTTYDKKIMKMEQEGIEKELEVKATAEIYQNSVQKKQAISQKYKDYESRRDEVQTLRDKYLMNRKNIEFERENVQKGELKRGKSIDGSTKTEKENMRLSKMNRTSKAGRMNLDNINEETTELIDYNFLEEFFQRIFEITGAKDG